MKLILIFLFLIVFSCQHSSRVLAGKFGTKNERDYFSQISSAERAEALQRAEVFTALNKTDKPVQQLDLIEDILKKECAVDFEYRNGQDIHWPEQTCTYVPDTERKLGGGSPKFLCAFEDPSHKKDVVIKSVKYSNKNWGFFSGEVQEVLLATNLAKLMGFPVTYYCPVRIQCKNCPSENPWKQGHSSEAAREGAGVYFEYAMIGKKINAAVISEDSKSNSPNGVGWNEIKTVNASSEEEKRRLLIEREAWMLWTHFLQLTDHHAQNTHLVCEKSKLNEDGESYFCEAPVLYTHDYGYAFNNHLNLVQWEQYPTLVHSRSGLCEGILSKRFTKLKARDAVEGLILDSSISEDAKNLFLEKILSITDEQWRSAYQLAKAQSISNRNANDFLQIVKAKISELQAIKCSRFDEKKSVLSRSQL